MLGLLCKTRWSSQHRTSKRREPPKLELPVTKAEGKEVCVETMTPGGCGVFDAWVVDGRETRSPNHPCYATLPRVESNGAEVASYTFAIGGKVR